MIYVGNEKGILTEIKLLKETANFIYLFYEEVVTHPECC